MDLAVDLGIMLKVVLDRVSPLMGMYPRVGVSVFGPSNDSHTIYLMLCVCGLALAVAIIWLGVSVSACSVGKY